jgi:hypothetical protein
MSKKSRKFLRNDLDFENVVCVRRSSRTKSGLSVEPRSVKVSRKEGGRVRWVSCTPGARLRIRFKKDDPFLEPTVYGGTQGLSGSVSDRAKLGRYKYAVRLSVGKKTYTIDPDVDVQP